MSVKIAASRLSFNDRMQEFLDIVEFRRAVDQEDLEAIYRLRYEAYRREESIDANDSKICTDEIDGKPNEFTFGLYVAGQLVSSVRLNIVTRETPFGPGMMNFSDLLQDDLDNGMVFIDPSRFVTDAEAAKLYPELPYMTLRLAVLACGWFHADYCLSVTRLEHRAFYRRVFKSKPISDVRSFPYVNFDVQLMRADVEGLRDNLREKYPFFAFTYLEQRQLFGAQLSKNQLIAA